MLTLRCFGEVTASDKRGVRIPLRSRKHTGLLLYLVAHARTVHMREELAHLLWDRNDRKARHSLSQALYDIRSSLGPLVAVDTNTVRLVPNRISYELDEFERAFQARDHESVMELYRGEFASELLNLGAEEFDRWLDSERERCRVLVAMALKNAQHAAEERGDWDQTCLAALRLVRQNEFDEEAHCALMRGLCMKGDHASALAHYRALGDARWLGSALRLAELAEWAEGRYGSTGFVVREPAEAALCGRDAEFRQLSGLLRATGPIPVRVALVGERGMGKRVVMRAFARVLDSAGGLVQWLPSNSRETPLDLVRELQRHPRKLRLIFFRADTEDWFKVDSVLRTSDLSRALVIGLSEAPVARRAEAAGLVDVVLTFDPLDDETCAAFVYRADRGCSPRQAATSTRLAGGNPTLARAIAQAWVRVAYDPPEISAGNDGGRLAYEQSAEVRSLVDRQLEPLSPGERELAATLALLTPAARAHAESIVAECSSRADLEELRAKGWIRSLRSAVELTRPLAGQVLTWSLAEEERARIHLEAARVLERGGLGARAAAASEFASAGRSSRVFDLGCDVAFEALRQGRSPVAGQAATLAFERAAAGSDRLRAGFLLAEAELQRGRFRRAAGVLHQLAALADTGNDLSRVHLALARAAVASGDRFTHSIHGQRLAESREHTTNEALDRAITIQLAVLKAMDNGSRRTRDAAFDAIRRTLCSLVADDTPYAGNWCDAFRLLFNQVGRRGTRSEARLLLETNRHALSRLGYEGSRTVEAAECWVAMRGAHLRDALELMQKLPEPPDQNRHESATLNNLGAVLLELGDFDAALVRLRSCRDLDEALESPVEDRVYALLNQALCAFFQGDAARCRGYTEQMLLRPDQAGPHLLSPQAWALNGLLALTDQDQREIETCLQRLEGCAEGGGDNDQYLVNWFLAAALGPGRREDAIDELIDAANRTVAVDRLSAEKLRVLAGAFSAPNGPGDQPEARGFLRSAGASWFVRFANNWSRDQM
ncbi:BTAD domain-containing putative transcriptional regulator [Candidatus Palauibacter sp.]|uniref:BTAD domain-containing putative transcriptional regulator n=1 Tax=Candidatus Palauibacter sp. TaxID=3101350 RepID=UPI003B5CE5D1